MLNEAKSAFGGKTKIYNLLCVLMLLVLTHFFCSCSEDAPNNPDNGGGGGSGTVHGKVIDEVGIGLVNVTVVIGGNFATTAFDGSFTIEGVTAPYDLKIVQGSVGIEYKSVNTMSPQVLGIGITEQLRQCSLTVSIPFSKLGPNKKAAIIFTDTVSVQQSAALDGNIQFDTSATFNVIWKGNSQISGKIIVLIYSVDNNLHITQYELYGQKLTTLNDGSSVTVPFGVNDLPIPPSNTIISGSLNVPGGYLDATAKFFISFLSTNSYTSSTQYIELSYIGFATPLDAKPGPAYVFNVPSNLPASNKLIVTGVAKSNNSPGINSTTSKSINCTPGSANNNIVLETVPLLIAPGNGQTADTNTIFTHSPGSGSGIYITRYSSTDNTKLFYTFTSSTGSRIPNLKQYGLDIGINKTYNWYVAQFNGVNSVDDMLSVQLVNNNNLQGTVITDLWNFITPADEPDIKNTGSANENTKEETIPIKK